MARYIIKRHGSNAANQSLRQEKVLGTVDAVDEDSAKAVAASIWSCYSNQFFEAISLEGRTRKADREEAAEEDAWRAWHAGGCVGPEPEFN